MQASWIGTIRRFLKVQKCIFCISSCNRAALGECFFSNALCLCSFYSLKKRSQGYHRGKIIFLLINMVQKTIYSDLLKSLIFFSSFFQLQMKAGQQEKPSYCFHHVDTRAPWKMPDWNGLDVKRDIWLLSRCSQPLSKLFFFFGGGMLNEGWNQ